MNRRGEFNIREHTENMFYSNLADFRWIQNIRALEFTNYDRFNYENERLMHYLSDLATTEEEIEADVVKFGREIFPPYSVGNDELFILYDLADKTHLNKEYDREVFEDTVDGRTYFCDRVIFDLLHGSEGRNRRINQRIRNEFIAQVELYNRIRTAVPAVVAPYALANIELIKCNYVDEETDIVTQQFILEKQLVYEDVGLPLYVYRNNENDDESNNESNNESSNENDAENIPELSPEKIYCAIYAAIEKLHLAGFVHRNLNDTSVFVKIGPAPRQDVEIRLFNLRNAVETRDRGTQNEDLLALRDFIWEGALRQAGPVPDPTKCRRDVAFSRREHALQAFRIANPGAGASRRLRKKRLSTRRRK
jgi:hypothetical protein